MKYPLHFRMITMLMVLVLSLFAQLANAQAKGFALVTTVLTIQTAAPSIEIGGSTKVLIQLTSTNGEPVPDQPIELLVDGVLERRARTDATGNVTIKVKRDVVGTYVLTALFKGVRVPSLGTSKASTELVVVPAVVEIQITPPLPGIRFSLDNQVFSSNKEGIARLEVEKIGMYRLELLTAEASDPDLKMEFSRWGDDTFVPYRDIEVPVGKPLEVGFEVSYQVSHTFVDREGKPVDPARITSVTIKGSNGTTYTFEDNEPHWLLAGRVIRLNNGLEQTKILYSVIDVTMDGSNVVSQAQQRFYIEPNDVWSLKLLLYSARFTARDALFRFAIGTGIDMEYPNGDIQTFQFNSSNEYFIEGLARGIYRVTVIGAHGIAPPTPIALSRDQDVELLVLSYFDLGVMATLGLSFALGLLFFGRPKVFTDLAAMPKRVIAVFRRKTTQPLGPADLIPQTTPSLKTRKIGNQTTFLARLRSQLSSKLNLLRNASMPKRWVAQLDIPEPMVPYFAGKNTAQVDDVSQLAVEVEVLHAPTPSTMPGVETIAPGEASVDTLDIPLPEVIETSQVMPLTLVKEEDEVVSQEVSSEQVETLTAPDQIQTIGDPIQPDKPEEMLESCLAEIGAPMQTEMTPACQSCGSIQITKNGINRRGQQQYLCKTCGTHNPLGTKRARKSRRKKNTVNPA
jgi:predicted RNA-binding Zn-ribbon protein involved in translation (DUF1610 family)